MIEITQLDHLVLTVRDMDATIAFYTQVLGMEAITFGEGRKSLRFGQQKINLHPHATESDLLVADVPTPGSADLCFLTETPLDDVIAHLDTLGVERLTDAVPRTGARGAILSVYFRDPDGNLIEVCNQVA